MVGKIRWLDMVLRARLLHLHTAEGGHQMVHGEAEMKDAIRRRASAPPSSGQANHLNGQPVSVLFAGIEPDDTGKYRLTTFC